jgi:hypothetical protein
MRTTLTLDDHVLDMAKTAASRLGKPFHKISCPKAATQEGLFLISRIILEENLEPTVCSCAQ